jgi:hypothetical protein
VYGTPSATPLALPKLERMSLRTTPLSDSTLTLFDPSPGYGPAVSSGITEQDVTAAVVVVAPDVVDVVDELVPFVVAVALFESLPLEQPAATTPRPPSTRSA